MIDKTIKTKLNDYIKKNFIVTEVAFNSKAKSKSFSYASYSLLPETSYKNASNKNKANPI